MRLYFFCYMNIFLYLCTLLCEYYTKAYNTNQKIYKNNDSKNSTIHQRLVHRSLGSIDSHHLPSVLLAWCAKEALYKVLDTPNLDFAKQLEVQGFETKTEGEFLVKSVTDDVCIHKLNYICNDDYFLVWVEKNG